MSEKENKKIEALKSKVQDTLLSSLGEIKGFKDPAKNPAINLMSGKLLKSNFFRNNWKFIAYITFLLFCYVGNRYWVDGHIRRIKELTILVDKERAININSSKEWSSISSQSNIAKLIKERGIELEEATTPPFEIK
ncbi:MAG: hypothetical protein MJZ24_09980 [Paludibacteraceae bacterium]|nr:hypothetical protein [Candidatus Physcocola equi]MCQ2235053.1 hypothetical protein [Paludibacteraceae bacterium]